MSRKRALILGITVSLIFINTGIIFSQEPGTIQGPPLQGASSEPEIQWLWGEVISVDTTNNQINVKYLDYENDMEKEIAITVDEKTTYENVKSINELKAKDNVSIDYIVSSEGKNLAKNISLEKAENTQGLQEGNMPEELKLTPPTTEESSKTTPSY